MRCTRKVLEALPVLPRTGHTEPSNIVRLHELWHGTVYDGDRIRSVDVSVPVDRHLTRAQRIDALTAAVDNVMDRGFALYNIAYCGIAASFAPADPLTHNRVNAILEAARGYAVFENNAFFYFHRGRNEESTQAHAERFAVLSRRPV